MTEKKKGFYLFFDWLDDLDNLDGADAWKIVKAIGRYQQNGDNPLKNLEKPLRATASMMLHQIQRREAISAVRAKAVKSRYEGGFVVQNSTNDEKTDFVEQTDTTYTSNNNSNTLNSTPTECENAPACAHAQGKSVFGLFENVFLTDAEYTALIERFGDNALKLIELFSAKLKSKGYKYEDHYATLLLWAEKDGVEHAATEKSYDTDDFFAAAMLRSYDEMNRED